jgi:hypothetical protein
MTKMDKRESYIFKTKIYKFLRTQIQSSQRPQNVTPLDVDNPGYRPQPCRVAITVVLQRSQNPDRSIALTSKKQDHRTFCIKHRCCTRV